MSCSVVGLGSVTQYSGPQSPPSQHAATTPVVPLVLLPVDPPEPPPAEPADPDVPIELVPDEPFVEADSVPAVAPDPAAWLPPDDAPEAPLLVPGPPLTVEPEPLLELATPDVPVELAPVLLMSPAIVPVLEVVPVAEVLAMELPAFDDAVVGDDVAPSVVVEMSLPPQALSASPAATITAAVIALRMVLQGAVDQVLPFAFIHLSRTARTVGGLAWSRRKGDRHQDSIGNLLL